MRCTGYENSEAQTNNDSSGLVNSAFFLTVNNHSKAR